MLYVLFICHENLVLRTCRDHLDILHVIGYHVNRWVLAPSQNSDR